MPGSKASYLRRFFGIVALREAWLGIIQYPEGYNGLSALLSNHLLGPLETDPLPAVPILDSESSVAMFGCIWW